MLVIEKRSTEPENKESLWLDLTSEVKLLKVYTDGIWSPIGTGESILPIVSIIQSSIDTANIASINANNAASVANIAANNANDKASSVDIAIENANTSSSSANNAALAANEAAANADEATSKATVVLNHPGYIGSDYYVYTWNSETASYNKTDTMLRPEGFSIYRSYSSITLMEADKDNVPEGKFVIINTGSVEDPDTAKLYVKGTTDFEYLVDMSGAIGFTGKTPQLSVESSTGSSGTEAVVTMSDNGTDESGNPKYKLTFLIPRGKSGVVISSEEPTDPDINVWIDPTGESNTIVVDKITMDESITAPANITGDVNGSVIKKIRSLHRRCLAKYLGNGKMAICYLQNDNSNFYHDGTAALLDGTEGDVMVYRPSYAHLYEYIDSDRFNISFAMQPLNGLWRTIDECLIGAYEAYSVNNKLYSRSGVPSAGNISQTNFKAYARARGAGYQLIDYDMHKEIPWLFYTLYGTRNCQAICGSGTNAYDKATGQTNGIGNTDTTTVNGNTMSVNFLGIENCWGNKYEFLDNVIYNPDASSLGVWQISDIKTGTIRRVQGVAPGNAWVCPKRMISNDELDVIAKEGGLSDSTGYCDGQYLSTSLTRVVVRSSFYSSSFGGVSFAVTSSDASSTFEYGGSRLAFRGEITVYDNVSEFKALPVL